MRSSLIAPLLFALGGSCFNAPFQNQGLYCDEDHDDACPPDQSCGDDGRCYWSGGSICDLELECPPPAADKATICGRVWNAATSQELRNASPTGESCDAVGPTATGACSLSVTLYVHQELLDDPTGSPPIDAGSVSYDDCGRFVAVNIPLPSGGQISVATDDRPGAPGGDVYALTSTTFFIEPGGTESGAVLVALDHLSVTQWTTDAGNPFGGQTFADVGASLITYRFQAEPTEGVTATVDGGEVPDDDYYFSDSDPYTRKSVDQSADRTGRNGSALVVNSPIALHAGVDGIPGDCFWSEMSAASTPGLIHHGISYALRTDRPDEWCE